MKRINYYAADTVFLFLALFNDLRPDLVERCEVKGMNIFVSKPVSALHIDHREVTKTAKELASLGSKTVRMRLVAEKTFAPSNSSG